MKWKLVFEDQFSSKKLDLKKWNYEIGGNGYGNNELQFYTNRDKNVFIQDNHLVLKAYQEPHYDLKYTSGKIYTKDLFSLKYGKVEVKAKSPFGRGIWPAIWMMPDDKTGGWPSCGEIDIMEIIGHEPNKLYGTIHYGVPHTYHGGTITLENESFADNFHVFGIEWYEDIIKWTLDGEVYHQETKWFQRFRDGKETAYPAPFNKHFYVILNLAIGGKWPGYPDDTTQFPQEFVIDYVKIYQKL